MRIIDRTKSEPNLYNSDTSSSALDQSPEHVSHCQTVCNGSDTRTFHVDGESGATSLDMSDDNTQYVALDCEFVGVGPKQLSALGTFALNNFNVQNCKNLAVSLLSLSGKQVWLRYF